VQERTLLVVGVCLAVGRIAVADPALRRRDATLAEIMRGPYRSSRLFSMPVADVVGAYQMTVSGDGSLLQETGILSFAGVAAIGFGDLAQLEYRHTAAIGVERTAAPVPAVGVQLKIPIPERKYIPSLAIAFRYGVPRDEKLDGGVTVTESVTDFYVVARLQLWGAAQAVSLHAGARISQAKLLVGAAAGDCDANPLCDQRYILLPTFGIDIAANRTAHLIAEAGIAPQFRYDQTDPVAEATVRRGFLGRLGTRWFIHPAFSIDASLGYQLEVAGAHPSDGLKDVVHWDIRVGAELSLPWGGFACKGLGIFCEEGGGK
jgi:hypothetical protein